MDYKFSLSGRGLASISVRVPTKLSDFANRMQLSPLLAPSLLCLLAQNLTGIWVALPELIFRRAFHVGHEAVANTFSRFPWNYIRSSLNPSIPTNINPATNSRMFRQEVALEAAKPNLIDSIFPQAYQHRPPNLSSITSLWSSNMNRRRKISSAVKSKRSNILNLSKKT